MFTLSPRLLLFGRLPALFIVLMFSRTRNFPSTFSSRLLSFSEFANVWTFSTLATFLMFSHHCCIVDVSSRLLSLNVFPRLLLFLVFFVPLHIVDVSSCLLLFALFPALALLFGSLPTLTTVWCFSCFRSFLDVCSRHLNVFSRLQLWEHFPSLLSFEHFPSLQLFKNFRAGFRVFPAWTFSAVATFRKFPALAAVRAFFRTCKCLTRLLLRRFLRAPSLFWNSRALATFLTIPRACCRLNVFPRF